MKGRRKNKVKNPVAKFMNSVAKPKVERDRTKYTRKKKHKHYD